MSIAGEVVVVTGSSRGIGAGIALRCAEAGALVVGISRSGSGPPDGHADRFCDLVLDIREDDAADRALATALDRFGRVDALVNNAGVLISANCWEQDDAEWDAMLATNVTAPFLFSQRFARHWVAGDENGVILNVCSLESEIGWKSPPQAAYATSKGTLLGLTRAMALDLAPSGIRVVAIGPGVIDTGMATPDRKAVERRIPLGNRFGTPEQIGDAAVFLLSERAEYITGEILYVDGGYRVP